MLGEDLTFIVNLFLCLLVLWTPCLGTPGIMIVCACKYLVRDGVYRLFCTDPNNYYDTSLVLTHTSVKWIRCGKHSRLDFAHHHGVKPGRSSQSLPNQPTRLTVLLHFQLIRQPSRHQPTALPEQILLFTTYRPPRPLCMERGEE